MANYHEDIINIELEGGSIHRSFLNHSIGAGDNSANRFGVRLFRNGVPENVSGSCFGLFIRADGQTVTVNGGTVTGNMAYVTLPEACYAVEGQFCLTIKVSGTGNAVTLRIIDGVVSRTSTSVLVDPGTVIPSIEDLIEEIEAAVASIPPDYSVLSDGFYHSLAKNSEALATKSGKMVDQTGTEITYSIVRCSDFVELSEDVCAIRMYAKSGEYGIYPLFCLYDENRDFLTYYETYSIPESGIVEVSLTNKGADFRNAKYIRFNLSDQSGDQDDVLFEMKTKSIHVGRGASLGTSLTDANNIKPNEILYKYGDNEAENLPFAGWYGNMFSVYGGDGNADSTGLGVIALGHNGGGRVHFQDAWGASKAFSGWSEFVLDRSKYFTGSFPASATVINTGIRMLPNASYIVHFKSALTGLVNIYGLGNVNNVARVNAGKNEAIFKNDNATRTLCLYNYDGNADDIDIEVIPLRNQPDAVRTYWVSQTDPMADYSSFTQCLLDLKDDISEKIIYVDGGDYDIFQEYEDAGVPAYTGDNPTYDYFDYCVWVPKNTHIIGRGIVRLKWMPDADEVTYNQSVTVSPLNVAASCIIENVEVHCKNGRYCLHNDALGKAGYNGAIQIYKDVKFIKYANDPGRGWSHTIGFGIDREMRHEFINCDFINKTTGWAFYGHARSVVGGVTLTEAMSSEIVVTDCVIDASGTEAVMLGNVSSTTLHIRTRFSGCSFNKPVMVTDSTPGTNSRNAYDVTFLNCGTVDVEVTDESNPYPVKAYNTTINA